MGIKSLWISNLWPHSRLRILFQQYSLVALRLSGMFSERSGK